MNDKINPYQNPELPVEERVEDLLKRMTLEEKVEQLYFSDNGNERLGIPNMLFGECLHGIRLGFVNSKPGKATIFPQAIAMASSWDPELISRAAGVIAKEARALGMHNCYAPVLDVVRDFRWGRTEETYGEDPLVCARMGVAYIKGLQGTGEEYLDENHIIATAKHYPAYGKPESGINGASMDISERSLREVYMVPFEAAVKEARVASVMPAHTDINGIPAHADKRLIEGILRGEWGFDGFVVSDNRDIFRLYKMHFIASSEKEAAKIALEAGVDQELSIQKDSGRCYFEPLIEGVRDGSIDEYYVDRAVRRILKAKFLLGLFDARNSDSATKAAVLNCPEHRNVALEVARKSIVLLKNEGKLLPLNPDEIKSIAVIGPNADSTYMGDYSGLCTAHVVTVLEGIKNAVDKDTVVYYAKGCDITSESEEGFDEAVKAARAADVAVVVVGESEETTGEGKDRDSLDLPGVQEKLIKAVYETGTPVIVVLQNGRPLSINWTAKHVPAILETWFSGVEGGTAIAEILFGKCNPSGKLTVSFPRSVGQLPVYYSKKADFTGSGRGLYVNSDKSPLYPFGYGLSYTEFKYSNLTAAPSRITADQSLKVGIDITNIGSFDGEEIVQLYIRDQVSTVTRPLMELKDFTKVFIKAGETKRVVFNIGWKQLSMLDLELKRVVEPGKFTVMVGRNSTDYKEIEIEVVEAHNK